MGRSVEVRWGWMYGGWGLGAGGRAVRHHGNVCRLIETRGLDLSNVNLWALCVREIVGSAGTLWVTDYHCEPKLAPDRYTPRARAQWGVDVIRPASLLRCGDTIRPTPTTAHRRDMSHPLGFVPIHWIAYVAHSCFKDSYVRCGGECGEIVTLNNRTPPALSPVG